ncbi:MAG: alanine--glyoxylate aminotransferase family protein, partial [Desulfovibrionaceae bacterium]
LSDRAWRKAEQVAPSCFYFNVLKERANIEKNQTLFSSPVSHILGLAESLDMLMTAGLDTVYRKQWALTLMARQGLQALGLELFVPQHFTWGLTAVSMPAGVDAGKVLQICADSYGVIMAGGQDAMKGKIIRMGHMGWLDWADIAAGLHALARSLSEVGGYSASRDYLEQALAAYHAALDVTPGSPIPLVRS